MSTTSPNMGLIIPTVSTEPGPAYASDVNDSLTTIDSHNHSTGQGVQITPNGMNISSDLSFGQNNATLLRSTRFVAQSSPLALSPDVGCAYVSGADLYFNDTSGNQVRITQSGGVAGSPGSITGLVSPASVTYSAPTFVFQSGVNTAGNLDARSVVFRNSAVSSFGLTLNPPAAMAADYNLTLPPLPAVDSFVTLNSSGVFGSTPSAVGQQISGDSGIFTVNGSSGGFGDVLNLSVNITTLGNPVMLFLIANGTNSCNLNSPNGGGLQVQMVRGSTSFYIIDFSTTAAGSSVSLPPGVIQMIDPVGAGTYAYKIQARPTTGAASIIHCKLVAYEL